MNCRVGPHPGRSSLPGVGSGGVESRLSAAILRTSASLNVGTVLHEVVESARALTVNHYSARRRSRTGRGRQVPLTSERTQAITDKIASKPAV